MATAELLFDLRRVNESPDAPLVEDYYLVTVDADGILPPAAFVGTAVPNIGDSHGSITNAICRDRGLYKRINQRQLIAYVRFRRPSIGGGGGIRRTGTSRGVSQVIGAPNYSIVPAVVGATPLDTHVETEINIRRPVQYHTEVSFSNNYTISQMKNDLFDNMGKLYEIGVDGPLYNVAVLGAGDVDPSTGEILNNKRVGVLSDFRAWVDSSNQNRVEVDFVASGEVKAIPAGTLGPKQGVNLPALNVLAEYQREPGTPPAIVAAEPGTLYNKGALIPWLTAP